MAATMVRVAPHKVGDAAGREQPSPWRPQTCPPQLAQEWGFPRPQSSEVRQCPGPFPTPDFVPAVEQCP